MNIATANENNNNEEQEKKHNDSSCEKSLPELSKITVLNKQIILLGTAHVSRQSVEDVRQTASTHDIDMLAVELDIARYNKLVNNDTSFDKLDIFTVIKQKKAMMLLSSLVLSAFQRRLGNMLNVMPGSEMLAAVEESKRLEIPCELIDRAADVTLKRAWVCSSFWSKQKILASLFAMIFSREKISEKQLNELKTMSLQGGVMEELSKFLPNLKTVLVDERDEYLAIKLLQGKGSSILAVLGAAHVPGVIAHLQRLGAQSQSENSSHSSRDETQHNTRLQDLEYIPQKKFHIGKYLIPTIVISLIIWGFFKGGTSHGTQNIIEWYLINGSLSLLGAIIAWAHPLTMILAFLAAPLTSINPLIGVGLVTGLSEAFFRKPRVEDISHLQTMKLNFKSFYKNRITRTLLVFFLTTLGSAVGTFIGIFFLL